MIVNRKQGLNLQHCVCVTEYFQLKVTVITNLMITCTVSLILFFLNCFLSHIKSAHDATPSNTLQTELLLPDRSPGD